MTDVLNKNMKKQVCYACQQNNHYRCENIDTCGCDCNSPEEKDKRAEEVEKAIK